MSLKELGWPSSISYFSCFRSSFLLPAWLSDMGAPIQSPKARKFFCSLGPTKIITTSGQVICASCHTKVTEVDPGTNVSHIYEGVALDQVVPSSVLASPGEQIEVEFGSHQTLTISAIEVDTSAKAIIADTIDGKPLSGDTPYWLVFKSRDRGLQKIINVQTSG